LKLFYTPFYLNDWLTSDARIRLTLPQRAIYLELVMLAYMDDGLPNDPTFLTRKLGIQPEHEADLQAALKEFIELPDGRLHHPRAIALLAENAKRGIAASKAAISGWAKPQDESSNG
jgi:uncharacterized protein YdaU (DUF1376 family)